MIEGQKDVIIIGSGISSLTCGILLAKAGRKVCVVERYTKPGGYLHCFERYGHRFDTGAHYSGALGEGEPFRALLSYLGVYDDEIFVPLGQGGFDVIQFRDFQVTLPRGYPETIHALSAVFPEEAAGIAAYFALIEQYARSFPTYNFARVDQDDEEVTRLLDTSLETVVRAHVRNPRLQCVLYTYCALHGVAPADVSIGLHALVTDSLVRGAWGFRHGGDYLAQRYVAALERAGGEFISACGVTSMRSVGKKITEIVFADGSSCEAKTVISGIHPKATFGLLKDYRPSPAFASRLGGTEESIGFLGIYGVCDQPPPQARDRNYYYFDWSEPEVFNLLRHASSGDHIPNSAFVCRPDRVPAVAVAGEPARYPISIHSAVQFAPFAAWEPVAKGRKPRAYYQQKLAMAERSLDFVGSWHPGFKRSVVKYDVSTPLTNIRYNGSEEGTAYGIYHSIRNTGARAIGPRTHLENLLLTGQSSLFPGLFGAAVSGLRTAGNLIGIKDILRELRPMVRL